MPTDDGCSSTGSSAEPSTTRAGAAGRRRRRSTSASTSSPSAWVGIAPARNTRPLDSAGGDRGPSRARSARAGSEVPFPYEAAVFDNRFPSFRPTPPPPPAPRRADRAGAAGGARSCSTPTATRPRSAALADRARPRPRSLDRPRHASCGAIPPTRTSASSRTAAPRSAPRSRTRTGRSTRSTTSRRSRRRRPRPTAVTASATGQLPLVRGDAGRRLAPTASSPRTRASSWRFPSRRGGRSRWRYGRAGTGSGAWPSSSPEEQRDLALALRDVARRYDALFDFPLPYMMVAQEAPHDEPDWHLAFELYPLHRAPGVTKIRASVETGLGLFLNDVAPEDAARPARRRSTSPQSRSSSTRSSPVTQPRAGDALVSAEATGAARSPPRFGASACWRRSRSGSSCASAS